MRSWYSFSLMLLCLLSLAAPGFNTPLRAQMVAVINTLADDDSTHPWDDPDTPEDESMDGKCEDMRHQCSLRAALQEASYMDNGAGWSIDVTLNLTGTIVLGSSGELTVTDGSNIHGNGQTAIAADSISGTALSIGHHTTVSGLKFTRGVIALAIAGDGNNVYGNTISNDGLYGILVGGNGNIIGGATADKRNVVSGGGIGGILVAGANNTIIGNYIGLNALGQVNGFSFGVFVNGDDNTIGGTDPGTRNVISGNSISGIAVSSADTALASITTILGNYIGTDPTGKESRPNGYGVQVSFGRALIGGTLAPEKNIISGNTYGGIETRGDALTVRIIGNDIGLNVDGDPLGNDNGIELSPGSFDGVVEGNRISYNAGSAILIDGTVDDPSWNHRIYGNELTRNGLSGIDIKGYATDIVIGSSLTQDFDPNLIQYNAIGGIWVLSDGVTCPHRNTIRKNDFLNNGYKGIVVTAGCQDSIQPPSIQNYTDLGGGLATVTVTHHRPGSRIDVYTAEVDDSSRYEGRHWLGSGVVPDSLVPFGFGIDACSCSHIVATATDQNENTSAFSDGFGVVSGVGQPAGPRIPTEFSLGNAFPNPFNPVTHLQFSIPRSAIVTLKVYDVLGREVSTLAEGMRQPGYYSIAWDASGVPSGVYYYRLQAGAFVETKEILLIR